MNKKFRKALAGMAKEIAREAAAEVVVNKLNRSSVPPRHVNMN